MTEQEFTIWLTEVVGSHFPVVLQFVTDYQAERAWFKALEEIDYDDAVTVIHEALSGSVTAPTPYRGDYSNWPAFVRERATSLRWRGIAQETSWRDRRDEVKCRYCRDSGYVYVVHPGQESRIFRDPPDGWRPIVKTCVVACGDCEAGSLLADEKRSKPLLRYDGSRMCWVNWDDSHEERYRKLIKWWDEECGKAELMINYNPEFSEWSN